MRNAYRYKKLEGNGALRLLKISTTRSLVRKRVKYHYSLVHTTLDDAPPYETLSYVWGTTIQAAKLTLLDGTSIRITKTLDVILPRIAHHCNTGYLWVDQICIDQQNVEERGQQVSIMGNIYSRCAQVLVWLEIDHTLGPEFRSILETATRSFDKTTQLPDLAPLKPHISSHKIVAYNVLFGFKLILQSEWFSRAWVFQEVVLAPKSRVIVSYSSTREETVTSLYELYWTYKTYLTISDGIIRLETEQYIERHVYILAEMYNRWSKRHFGQEDADNISFARLLSTVTPHAQTSLSLDKLYAFFGLNNRSSIVLRPDYKLTFHQALVTTVVAIIKGTLSLDVFDFITTRLGSSSPSWVPDFTKMEMGSPFRPTLAEPKMDVVQDSSLQSGSGIIYPWAGSCDTQLLRVHGKRVDTIKETVILKLNDLRQFSDNDFHQFSDMNYIVKSILHDVTDNPNHSLNDLSCIDRRVLSALKADGWWEDTSDLVNAGSQADASIEHENSERTGIDTDQKYQDWREFTLIKKAMAWRQLHTTQQGLFATGTFLQKGDLICILHGCSHPVILRPAEYDTGRYTVRGACYLEGWMDPWANGKIYWAEDEADEFVLV